MAVKYAEIIFICGANLIFQVYSVSLALPVLLETLEKIATKNFGYVLKGMEWHSFS